MLVRAWVASVLVISTMGVSETELLRLKTNTENYYLMKSKIFWGPSEILNKPKFQRLHPIEKNRIEIKAGNACTKPLR